MTKRKCEVCGWQTEFAKTAAIANRALGYHKFKQHGIRGMDGRVRYLVYSKGMTPEQAKAAVAAKDAGVPTMPSVLSAVEAKKKHRQEYGRMYREKQKLLKQKQQNPVSNGTGAIPAYLPFCPKCQTRFWMCVGEQ